MAETIERLLADAAERRTLTENAARAVQAYDLETYAGRIVALYRKLLEGTSTEKTVDA